MPMHELRGPAFAATQTAMGTAMPTAMGTAMRTVVRTALQAATLAVLLATAAMAQPASAPAAGDGSFQAGVKAFDQGRHAEAFAIWLPLAEQGRVEAQFNIAVLYEQGLGVGKSEAEAARWYRAAAERGE